MLAISLTALLLVLGVACQGTKTETPQPTAPQVTTQELEGLLQAVDGKEVVIALDDGSKVRIETEKTTDDTKSMVGEDVKVKIETREDKPKVVEMEKSPSSEAPAIAGIKVTTENLHFTGIIESMGADAWVIGGKTFKVNAATTLDQGLAVGVTAEVEFIVLANGSMLATKIETPATDDLIVAGPQESMVEAGEDFSLTGVIQALDATKVVIGNKTFKIDANTLLDTGLKVGVMAKVEFVPQPDGSFLALKVETGAPDSMLEAGENFTASGPIEVLQPDLVVVDGRKFKIDAGTILDDGLAVGVLAKVEFIVQPDGTMLAKEVETAKIDEGVNLYFSGAIQSMSPAAWVIGGKTFKIGPATVLDEGLAVGVLVNVEFVMQPDGSMLAVHIEDTGFEFIGMLQAIAPDAYTVGGRVFKINANTLIEQGLKVRKLVQVNFIIQADGSLLALQIKVPKTKVQGFSFKGVVQSLSTTSLVASGQTFQVDALTNIGPGVAVGTEVIVTFDIKPGGSLVALMIQSAKAAKK